MRLLLIILAFVPSAICYSQDGPFFPLPFVEREAEFDIAPQFPWGSTAMMSYFADSVHYPEPELTLQKGGFVAFK